MLACLPMEPTSQRRRTARPPSASMPRPLILPAAVLVLALSLLPSPWIAPGALHAQAPQQGEGAQPAPEERPAENQEPENQEPGEQEPGEQEPGEQEPGRQPEDDETGEEVGTAPEILRAPAVQEPVTGRVPALELEPREEPPPEHPEDWGRERLVDRIVAVVDLDPVLQSEVEQAIQLGLAERRPDESPEEFRLRVLQDLIDQRLRYQEVGRFGPGVAVEAIEAEIDEIRAAYPSPEAFEEDLERSGTSMEELRQIVARQLAVVEYVDQRLGPRIFVSLDEIREFYHGELEPALRRQGVEPPPLEEVREDIRELLKQRHLNAEIQRWTEELRRQADIQILVDLYPRELPPVIHRIGPEG